MRTLLKPSSLTHAAGFFDSRRNIVRRDDAGAEHALGRDFAEVVHPVVVGFGDGGGEIGIESVDGEHEQTAARIEDRDIESFFIHGADLRDVVEVARFFFGVTFRSDFFSRIGAQRGIRLFGVGRGMILPSTCTPRSRLWRFKPDGRAIEIFLVDILCQRSQGSMTACPNPSL